MAGLQRQAFECFHYYSQNMSFVATRSAIAGYETYEEVQGLSKDGSHCYIDIIAFKPNYSHCYIIDPSIRFEIHENQPEEVDVEKGNLYEGTVNF